MDKIGGIGASEIGKLFTKAGIKSKTAQTLAFEKAKELLTGERKSFSTKATEHGILNEYEAFNKVIEPIYPKAELRSSDSLQITEGLWATPDVITDKEVIDIKCPFSPYTYFDNIRKVKNTYIHQVNMQMVATGLNKGYLCFYLTAEIDENGIKKEYDIPFKDRYKIVEIQKDDSFKSEMFKRFDEFKVIRDNILTDLTLSIEIDDKTFYTLGETKKVTKFKDKANLTTWGGQIVNYRNEFYVIEDL